MCRYPPSTIHRYLDLPSTQRNQTHTSHRHNTPHLSRPWSKPPNHSPPTPPTPPTPPQPKHRHMSNTPPVSTGLVKPKPNSLIHSPPSPPTPPRAKHIYMSNTPPTPPTSTSYVLDRHLNHVYHSYTHSPQPHLTRTPHQHCRHPRTLTLSQHTHMQHKQQYMHHSHHNNRTHNIVYYDNLTNRQRTTNTTQTHRPNSKTEINLIILQVNINGLRKKLEELKLLIHDTHADIITIQETKLNPKAKTPKIHNFTAVRTHRLHKAGGGLITLIRNNITFTTTDIPSTINTHNTELQMVKVHINNTKHITIANIYIPPRDTTSTHYKTADTNIQHCIQYITNIPHSVLTGDVNAHSTLWLSYTDDHIGQLIADVISNSDHITLNTNTPTGVPNTTLQQTSSPDITTVSNTLYNRTSWTTQHALSSDHLPKITTINIRHLQKTQSPLSLRPPYPPNTHCQKNFHKHHAEYTSNLDLTINNKALPMATHPKVLGLTLDRKLTYSTHIHNISVQAHKPLQIIKKLTATGWGKQKETLMATYKAVMRPALEYASSVWSPIASSTSINKLQVMQNAALRTATGCTQDTNIQHLHDETLTFPIHEHLQLHASQYKQKTQHPSHPLHIHTTYFNTPRLKKHYF